MSNQLLESSHLLRKKQFQESISSKSRMGIMTYKMYSHKAFPKDKEAPGEQCVNKN